MRKQGKILFVKRGNTGWEDGKYGLPAGHVEAGESFSEAICREATEEVGVTIKPQDMKQVLAFHQKDEEGEVRVGIYFETTKWSGEPHNAEPHKHTEIAWFDEDNLPSTVIGTTAKKLQAIKDGQTYVEYGWEE